MKHIFVSLMFLLSGSLPSLSAQPLSAGKGVGECCRQGVEQLELQVPCRQLEGITERAVTVFLPAGYRQQTERRYPVLYLMHGIKETPQVWQQKGRLCEVVDSMTRCGVLRDMVIVCPAGDDDHMLYFNVPHWHYEDFFFQELLPYIEHNFRVRTDKGSRAVGGFSLGGGSAIVYGVRHPECFAMVYAISGYLRSQHVKGLGHSPQIDAWRNVIDAYNPIDRLLDGTDDDVQAWRSVEWCVAIGDHDFTLDVNMELVRAFRSMRLPYRFVVTPGRHNWEFVFPAMLQMLQAVSDRFAENEKK